ncbi:MAG: DUF1295 domain-containing protein [Alcanivoracaceae bacterium]|nr:DUF1295 domain-containing protein [Alcanivoracaceae bacterium]
MNNALWITAVVLSGACVIGWWRQCRTHNASHADVIWSFGVGAAALFYCVMGDGDSIARIITALMIGFWSLRLGWHIHHRIAGAEEDGRYQAMRSALGDKINQFHFFFFQAQGLLAWLFALPAWVIATETRAVPAGFLVAGAAVGIAALAGEALADKQLANFRAMPDSKGKTCREGLWRYSRHPNYFFEWLHWFSYPLLAYGAEHAMWLWLAPAFMFLFLWFVTGIPYTERQALKSRGEDYKRYQRETSMFFPWWPKTK